MSSNDDTDRDLLADLALCEATTPGPWDWGCDCWPYDDTDSDGVCWPFVVQSPSCFDCGNVVLVCRTGGDDRYPNSESDMMFIAAARDGWPAAIRRALTAEAELAKLRAAVAEAEVARLRAELTTAAAVRAHGGTSGEKEGAD